MKKILTLYFALSYFIAFSQEPFFEIDLGDFKNIGNAFEVVNKKNGDIALFLSGNNNIRAILYSAKEESIASIDGERPYLQNPLRGGFDDPLFFNSFPLPSDFQSIIGSTIIDDRTYQIYLTNTAQTKFTAIKYQFDKKLSFSAKIDLELKGEEFIKAVQKDNECLLLTINKKASILNLYSFDNDLKPLKKEIDLQNEVFRHWNGQKTYLFKLIKEPFGFVRQIDVPVIDNSLPGSVGVNNAITKLYVDGNTIILTFDSYRDFTQIITINLDNFQYRASGFSKPQIITSATEEKNQTALFMANIFMQLLFLVMSLNLRLKTMRPVNL